MDKRLQALRSIIKDMGSLLIAYSGGVDSTFLLKVSKDTVGDRVIAVTAKSLTYPGREYDEAQKRAREFGVRHLTIVSEELDIPEFSDNPPDRCYYCKRELFSKLSEIAVRERINYVADGSNLDDLGDFRPGMRAAEEAGIRSPLREAGLTKQDIRELSRDIGLSTWNKPSFACLASRFPYGDKIVPEGLHMVDEAEEYLHSLGFGQLRVRHHNNLARVEVPQEDVERFWEDGLRTTIVEKLKEIGYTYVTLDLQGYRSGSMNEALEAHERQAR
ncbi:MAG: ATP-dependent sacrificial sulfur transferase LarE [Dehalococcoidia bacterium]